MLLLVLCHFRFFSVASRRNLPGWVNRHSPEEGTAGGVVRQAGGRARRDVEHLGSVGNRAGLCALSALKCAKTFKENSVEWASRGFHVPDQIKN